MMILRHYFKISQRQLQRLKTNVHTFLFGEEKSYETFNILTGNREMFVWCVYFVYLPKYKK